MKAFVNGILAAALFWSAAHAAEPFGIVMGTPLTELDVAEPGPKAFLNSVPKPHPEFDRYVVWASDQSGVCLVIAISKLFENDRYGINVRSSFDKVEEALSKAYGPANRIDFRQPGGIWDETDEWVMSIKQNERIFGTEFQKVKDTEQGANLASLEMSVLALSSDTSALRLQYAFTNFDQCRKEIEDEANNSF